MQWNHKGANSFAAVGAPHMVSLQPLASRGAVSVDWSPPTDLCGLTNPQYIIQYGTTTSSSTTHPSTPTSSPFSITGLAVGQEYFVRVAVRTQSGSGDFSSWQSVTNYECVRMTSLYLLSKMPFMEKHELSYPALIMHDITMCKYWTELCGLWILNLTQ